MVRRFGTAVVLVALLAGCMSRAPHDSSGLPGDPPNEEFSWVTVLNNDKPELATLFEPGLVINGDDLYTDPSGGSPATSQTVWASRDGGHTWSFLAAPLEPFTTLDGDIEGTKDGKTLWLDELYGGCAVAAASQDKGATWTANPLACVPGFNDRPWVVPIEGCEAVIYGLSPAANTVARTTDCGTKWIPSGFAEGDRIFDVQTHDGWGSGGTWNAARQTVVLSWAQQGRGQDLGTDRTDWHPAVALSHDRGATWTLVEAPSAGGEQAVAAGLVRVAADDAGNLYLTWSEVHGDDLGIFLATSTDDGLTWSQARRVDDGPGSKALPEIVAGAPGRIAIAYYETEAPGRPSDVAADAEWNVTLAWTTDALNDSVFQHATFSHNIVQVGPICLEGTVCSDLAPGGPICVPAAGCANRGGRDQGDYFAIAAFADGRVASVWTSSKDAPDGFHLVFGATLKPIVR